MNSKVIRLLKEKMSSTPIEHERVVEIQQKLGGEIFVLDTPPNKFKKTKSSSISCNNHQVEIFIRELIHQLIKNDAAIKKKVDIHTLGLILLHEIVQQLDHLNEPITTDKIIDYLFIYRCLKTSNHETQYANVSEETKLFQSLKGEEKRTVNYYEDARVHQEEIQLRFLSSGHEKISVGDIHLLGLYVFHQIYQQIHEFHSQAVLDYSTFQQYVNRIPQGYDLFKATYGSNNEM